VVHGPELFPMLGMCFEEGGGGQVTRGDLDFTISELRPRRRTEKEIE
jgi:hypothetical protein